MITDAIDYNGKALDKVNETMHEKKEEMILKSMDPITKDEARLKEIKNIEHQQTFEEAYFEDGMKVITGKWVDTEKVPGVAKA